MEKVDLSKVEKQIKKLPIHIFDRLLLWARSVETKGLREVRKIPGYHDEPLKGDRFGQRSVRLSRSYRAIYREHHDGSLTLIKILEVNKHEY